MQYLFGEHSLDTDRAELRVKGQAIPLGPIGFPLLLYLIENRARVVTRDEILDVIWGGRELAPSTIPTAISAIRSSLADDARSSKFIQNIYGRGYRFVAEVRVGGSPQENHRPELARLIESNQRQGFVGRAAELERLRGWAGDGTRVVFLMGVAGAGKTRLLERFAAECYAEGTRVLFARCNEVGDSAPYGPVVDLLTQAAQTPGLDLSNAEEVAREVVEGFLAEPQAVEPSDVASVDSGAGGRFQILSTLASAFSSLDREAETIAIVDDFHRADSGSASAFRHILAATKRTLLVFAYRDRELSGELAAGLAGISRASESAEMIVEALGRDAARELVEQRAGRSVGQGLADRVFELTGGNAFFLTKVADLLASKGGERSVLAGSGGDLPRATRDAVIRHVEALSPKCQTLLENAAVLGRELERDLLRVMMDWEPSVLDEVLAEARGAGVLEGEEILRFSHVLLRDALYESLGRRARDVHAKAYHAFGHIYGHIPGHLLAGRARHAVSAADRLDPHGRVEASRAAAGWATDRFAFSEAADHYARALKAVSECEPLDELLRSDLLTRLAECQHRCDRRDEGQKSARRAFMIARESDDPERMARAALAYSPGFFAIEVGVVDEFLVAALEEVRGLMAASDPIGVRVEVLARLAMALYWTTDRAYRESLADQSVELAEQLGGGVLAYAMTAREVALWDSSKPGAKEQVAGLALRMAMDAGEHEMELVYRVYRISCLLQMGLVSDAEIEIETFSAKAALVGHSNSKWFVDLFAAMLAMIRGDAVGAELATDRFVTQGRAVGDRNADHCRVVHRVYHKMEYGPIGDAADIAQEQWQRYQRVGAYRCSLPYLYWESGERLAAKVSFESLAREGFAAIPRNVEWLIGMAMLAEGCAEIGDKKRAPELFELLWEHRAECVVVGFGVAVFRPVAHFLGRLAATQGMFREAESQFSRALAIAETCGSSPWRAHGQYGLADLLVRRRRPGDIERAAKLLGASSSTAASLGMKPLLERSQRLVRLIAVDG